MLLKVKISDKEVKIVTMYQTNNVADSHENISSHCKKHLEELVEELGVGFCLYIREGFIC
jgi:hypothetical protein